jgi:hypothetical protein
MAIDFGRSLLKLEKQKVNLRISISDFIRFLITQDFRSNVAITDLSSRAVLLPDHWIANDEALLKGCALCCLQVCLNVREPPSVIWRRHHCSVHSRMANRSMPIPNWHLSPNGAGMRSSDWLHLESVAMTNRFRASGIDRQSSILCSDVAGASTLTLLAW